MNKNEFLPDADEEIDPVEAADSLPMKFQSPLPDRNCFGCPDDVSDEYCADCEASRQAREEHSPDRVRLFCGRNTPKSSREEPTLKVRIAKEYARSSATTYRGSMSGLILGVTGRQVFA